MKSMIPRALVGAMAVALLAASGYAFVMSYANALNYQARRYELLWQDTGGPADLYQWERAVDWSTRSLALDTSDPFKHLRHARLMQWYGSVPELDGDVLRERLDEASRHVERAMELHPHSADVVSSRAVLAARRGEVSEQMNADIVSSLELGPWERDVYLRAYNAGIFNWPRLEDDTRSALRTHFDAAVKAKPNVAADVFSIAERYGRLGLFCARLEYLNSQGFVDYKDNTCRMNDE